MLAELKWRESPLPLATVNAEGFWICFCSFVLYRHTMDVLYNYFKRLPHTYEVGAVTSFYSFGKLRQRVVCRWARIWIHTGLASKSTPLLLTTTMAGQSSTLHCLLGLHLILSSGEAVSHSFIHTWPNMQNCENASWGTLLREISKFPPFPAAAKERRHKSTLHWGGQVLL